MLATKALDLAQHRGDTVAVQSLQPTHLLSVNYRLMLRALRADIPCMLQRSPNMDIFADNIAFTDNISPRMGHQTNIVQGIEAYSRQLWSLRFHAALLFSRSHVSCPTCMVTA